MRSSLGAEPVEVLGVDRGVWTGLRELRIAPRAAAERLRALLATPVAAAEACVPLLDDLALVVVQASEVLPLHRPLQHGGEEPDLADGIGLVRPRNRLDRDRSVLREDGESRLAQVADRLRPRSGGRTREQQQVRTTFALTRIVHFDLPLCAGRSHDAKTLRQTGQHGLARRACRFGKLLAARAVPHRRFVAGSLAVTARPEHVAVGI